MTTSPVHVLMVDCGKETITDSADIIKNIAQDVPGKGVSPDQAREMVTCGSNGVLMRHH